MFFLMKEVTSNRGPTEAGAGADTTESLHP